ncbi:MAG: PSP1 domain-containing protein [Bacteroidales bacterium]
MSFKYIKKGGCCMNKGGCTKKQDNKLNTYDWLCDLPSGVNQCDFVEVQFKNTRKGYYLNNTNVAVEKGDLVAVEATPGHDIGVVSLTGELVMLQMKKSNVRIDGEMKKLYRKARPVDIEKYEEAKSREHNTMLRARRIAEDLCLDMKIGDVEYQGDCGKAIFYYIAEGRVDFRQLIKVLAEAFRVRIEMKQIGARQEAGRIGGIGPCGRELCCASWMGNFASVTTSAARHQDISLNPQKLAGQCAKLKCCINYEVDTYVEVQKQMPSREIPLETKDSTYYHFKSDILRREISYSTSPQFPANLVTISAKRVFEIIALNKRGIRVDQLQDNVESDDNRREFQDGVGDDSLTRFDKNKKRRPNSGRGERPERPERPQPKGEKKLIVKDKNTAAEPSNGDNQPKERRAERRPERKSETGEAPRRKKFKPRTGSENESTNQHREGKGNNNEGGENRNSRPARPFKGKNEAKPKGDGNKQEV